LGPGGVHWTKSRELVIFSRFTTARDYTLEQAGGISVTHVLPSISFGGLLEHVKAATKVIEPGRSKLVSIFDLDDGRAVKLLDIELVRLRVPLSRYLDLEYVGERVAWALRHFSTDLVHSYHFFADIYAVSAARQCRVPVIQTVAGIPQRMWANIFEYRDVWDWTSEEVRIARHNHEFVAKTLVVSKDMVGRLQRYGFPANELSLSYLGTDVDVPMLRAASQIGSLRLGFLHRVEPIKVSPAFVPAVALAVTAGVSVEVVIANHGSLASELIRGLAEAGATIDVVEPAGDVWGRIAPVDALVLPSLFEGVPITVLEAMARGVPVLASAVGGTPEAVIDGVTGVLVHPNDCHSLSRAIVRLAGDPELRSRMGSASTRLVRQKFNRADHLKDLISVYRGAVRQ